MQRRAAPTLFPRNCSSHLFPQFHFLHLRQSICCGKGYLFFPLPHPWLHAALLPWPGKFWLCLCLVSWLVWWKTEPPKLIGRVVESRTVLWSVTLTVTWHHAPSIMVKFSLCFLRYLCAWNQRKVRTWIPLATSVLLEASASRSNPSFPVKVCKIAHAQGTAPWGICGCCMAPLLSE